MEINPVVYKIPEDTKQEYLQHGEQVLNKWILKNVKCPSCNGNIRTVACGIGGHLEGGDYASSARIPWWISLTRSIVDISAMDKAQYSNDCIVRCESCDKQFTFRYEYYASLNSKSSLEFIGKFGWTTKRVLYMMLFVLFALILLGIAALVLYSLFAR
ncbi:hypothetical protein H0N98_05225 [Candidatus Micrarchaeota archaeon]|nr:hypothetical protein [Candidatus Micrarchaeota archaeon]